MPNISRNQNSPRNECNRVIDKVCWLACPDGHYLRTPLTLKKLAVLVALVLLWGTTTTYYFYSLTLEHITSLTARDSSLLYTRQFSLSKLAHNHESPEFKEQNFLSGDFKPSMDLSEAELKYIREKVKIHGNKLLLAWPTIPVPIKGSDSRAVDTIQVLSSCGFEVDLMYWRDYASEIRSNDYIDGPERATVVKAGVQRILGPYEIVKLKDSQENLGNYSAMVYWLWPHVEWLDALIEFVQYVARANGQTQMIAAVDDVGVAARLFQGSLLEPQAESAEEVQRFVLHHRPFAGQFDIWKNVTTGLTPRHFDHDKFKYAYVLLQQEMFLYSVSDVLVGINEQTVDFLRQMAPSIPAHRLSYVSPLQPSLNRKGMSILRNSKQFSERSGYVFFGYNNRANNVGMTWFAENVLPNISKYHILHIAGRVQVPSLCSCPVSCSRCRPLKPNVKCHGTLSEEELNDLIASSRIAINPVLETSGVATKTCRALALGTPVVVSDLDGTFDDIFRKSEGGRRCLMKGNDGASCFINNINALLNDQHQWRVASDAAPLFITKHYDAGTNKRDWISIIEEFTEKKRFQVILEGDADLDGVTPSSQNWHMAHTLSQQPNFQVTVIANIYSPVIPETTHVLPWKKNYFPPFTPGFHADVVIRQSWPPNFEEISRIFCGTGCRVVQLLPCEFGSLPESWITNIDANVDWLWAPSESIKHVFEKLGVRQAHVAVVPVGVDCNSLKKDTVTYQESLSDGSFESSHSIASLDTDNQANSFCWSHLSSTYANAILSVMKSHIQRTIPAFKRSPLKSSRFGRVKFGGLKSEVSNSIKHHTQNLSSVLAG